MGEEKGEDTGRGRYGEKNRGKTRAEAGKEGT